MKLRPPFADDLGIPVRETYLAISATDRANRLKKQLETATTFIWRKIAERDVARYEQACYYFLLLIVERAE